MNRRKFVGASVSILAVQSACWGGFNLTRKLYRWNAGMGDKWINWLIFLLLTIVPVYAVCVLVDLLVLNSIEFWSGSNPVRASLEGGPVHVARIAPDKVRVTRDGLPAMEVTFTETHAEMRMEGSEVARVIENYDGGTSLYDQDGRLTHVFTPDHMAEILAAARKKDVATVQALLDRGKVV